MDLLSLLLAQMRLSSSMLARFDAIAPWSVDIVDGKAITAYFLLTGECWFCPSGDLPAIHLHEGDLLLIPRWCEHRLCNSPDVASVPIGEIARHAGLKLWDSDRPLGEVLTLYHHGNACLPPDTQLLTMMFRAERSYQDNLVRCLPPTFHLAAADVRFIEMIRLIRQFILCEMETRSSGYAASAHRMAELLLIELLRSVVTARPKGTTGWLNGLGSPSIAAAMTALHLDPKRRWTLNELAHEARLSRSQFSAEFSRIVGQAPMDHVQGVRLQWATEAMMRGMALKELSNALGYSTLYGFHKAFVKRFGLSPGEWRNKHFPTSSGVTSW